MSGYHYLHKSYFQEFNFPEIILKESKAFRKQLSKTKEKMKAVTALSSSEHLIS